MVCTVRCRLFLLLKLSPPTVCVSILISRILEAFLLPFSRGKTKLQLVPRYRKKYEVTGIHNPDVYSGSVNGRQMSQKKFQKLRSPD